MKAQFIKTAVKRAGYPLLKSPQGKELPEVAIMGRSNVGKSSLINHLLGVRGLARTSATPGKTQHLNFFSVDDKWVICDLPGYGYAKVPESVRRAWGPMMEEYLSHRPSLRVIVLLFDIRRSPNKDDEQLVEWLRYYEKPFIFVLTKVDKVKANEKKKNAAHILETLHISSSPLYYSSTKNTGRKELLRALEEALA